MRILDYLNLNWWYQNNDIKREDNIKPINTVKVIFVNQCELSEKINKLNHVENGPKNEPKKKTNFLKFLNRQNYLIKNK